MLCGSLGFPRLQEQKKGVCNLMHHLTRGSLKVDHGPYTFTVNETMKSIYLSVYLYIYICTYMHRLTPNYTKFSGIYLSIEG